LTRRLAASLAIQTFTENNSRLAKTTGNLIGVRDHATCWDLPAAPPRVRQAPVIAPY
jgi:hypothetical protein